MFEVSTSTTKRELLNYLQSVAEINEDLPLKLSSLPNFLNTQVAFTIFLYQISNYPREIKWLTSESYIFELLGVEGVEIQEKEKTNLINNPVSTFQSSNLIAQPKKTFRNLEFSSTFISPKLPVALPPSVQPPLIEKSATKSNSNNQIDFVSNQIISTKNHNFLKEENVVSQNTLIADQIPKAPEFSHHFSLNLKTMFDDAKYQRSNLLNDVSTDNFFEDENESSIQTPEQRPTALGAQNLDSWIDRIAATKNALNSLKKNSSNNDFEVFSGHNSLSYNSTLPKKNNIFALVGGLSVIVLAVIGLLAFPTQVFTLTVKPLTVEASESLDLSIDDFEKFNTNIESQADIDASGKQEVQTDRAVGKVNLINPGNGSVSLDNGKFRLVYNDFVYSPTVNSTLPGSFSIPARNNANGQVIEFGIQATGPGAQYNLPENQKLEILNLKNDRVCGSCYALTVSEIKNSEISGDRIFSESDKSLLRNTADGKIDELRVNEISKIQEQNIFTNQKWYSNLSSDYKFSSEINQPAAKVNLTIDVNTDLYYIPQSKIHDKLKEKYTDLEKITDIALIETEKLNDKTTIVKSNFFFTYTKKSGLSTENVKKGLSGLSCDNAKKDLVITYDNINYVDCHQMGLQVPGLTPRVDVKIIETN